MPFIYSDRVIIDGNIKPATISFTEGKIVALHEGLISSDSEDVENYGNYVIMPGIIDTHVHINEPGRANWEGFETATLAAIAGGITTLVEMPLNASPVTTTLEAFKVKCQAAEGKLNCNVGFWGGIIPGNYGEIEPLAAAGVFGFKAFLTHSGIDEFPNVTREDLEIAMPIIAKTGLPLLVHCELSADTVKAFSPADNQDYGEYLQSRPAIWEYDAIEMLIELSQKHNCKTHVVHLSSATAIPLVAAAKEKGLLITAETAQHYLYFNAEDIADGKSVYKCAPPIREKANNDLLWEALQQDIIDFVATDHSPAPPEMKMTQAGNLAEAWGGISSLQFALPALWTAAVWHEAGISHICKWLCGNPAILAGLQHRKGKIEVGYDADFAVWSPEDEFTVRENDILHRHKITPYLGEKLRGKVIATYLGGDKVFEAGEIPVRGKGKILLYGK